MITYEDGSQPPLGDMLAEGQEQSESKLKPQQAQPVSESQGLATVNGATVCWLTMAPQTHFW